jgi:hypothetical protein
MPLASPNLDDRDFRQLMEDVRRRIVQSCPEWTDLSPSNPGMMLLELFAHLTEVMLYRLNRIPEKAYIEFLRLMGVKLSPPSAATTMLRFSVNGSRSAAIEIPAGTRVTIARPSGETEPPVFVIPHGGRIEAGKSWIDVPACHCELVQAELAGRGSGFPGLWVTARRPPIIAPTADGLDLVVGVEAKDEEIEDRFQAIQFNGRAYRIWREVEDFTGGGGNDGFVYVADRMTGTITFAPAVRAADREGTLDEVPRALGEVVKKDREIRLWYRRGGGTTGNVATNTLVTMKDPIPGVQVTNPAPATGGRGMEALENALIRGPQELHSLSRAVTASDFELLALRSSSAVVRAKAFTRVSIWTHAVAGSVEVLLVPSVPDEARIGWQVPSELVQAQENEEARRRILEKLDERRPLGTTCVVNWVRYKTVCVSARAVVHRAENPAAVETRILERLHQTIAPLPSPANPLGWRFGQPLRASHVYDIMLAEPGVSYVDKVRMEVKEVPEKEVRCVTIDRFQPHTWYAATPESLFRSLNDAEGWEAVAYFPEEEMELVRVHHGRAGIVAAATSLSLDRGASRIHVSIDCGETWAQVAQTAFSVHDMAWTLRDGVPVLLLASDVGLYELALLSGATPVQVLLDPKRQDLGLYAIATAVDIRGTGYVAVAARGSGGIFFSAQGGKQDTFIHIGLKDEDIRTLGVQHDGPRSFLWAGVAVAGNEEGKGCFCLELRGAAPPPEEWRQYQKGWVGGSCRAVAFSGSNVVAATHHAGVLRLDSSKSDPAWTAPVMGCGLPIRDVEHIFQPLHSVAIDPASGLILAGGPAGVYRSVNGSGYENASKREYAEQVTLPQTWLFCSGEHKLHVVREDEAERN